MANREINIRINSSTIEPRFGLVLVWSKGNYRLEMRPIGKGSSEVISVHGHSHDFSRGTIETS